MYRYIKAADSDYIKIGNMVIPKNAASYGYDSYENITRDAKRRYNAEKDAERKAAEEAAKAAEAEKLKQAAQPLYEKCKAAVEAAPTTDEKMEALFDILVPASGPAETMAGELVRAMMRINYRWFNDGDYFYTGYGLETCGSSAAFIADNIDDEIYSLIMGAADNINEEYDTLLNILTTDVLYYVMHTPETFWTKPKDSRNYTSSTLDELEERSRSFEYEIDTSGDIQEYIDNDCISWSDFQYWLEELTSYYGGTVNAWARDGFTIIDLNEDEYEEWDNMYERELQSYLDELEEEFPNFGMRGEEEEDY